MSKTKNGLLSREGLIEKKLFDEREKKESEKNRRICRKKAEQLVLFSDQKDLENSCPSESSITYCYDIDLLE